MLTLVLFLVPLKTAVADTVSFSIPVNISNTPGASIYPALAVETNGTAHVFWVQFKDGVQPWDYSSVKILYKNKPKDGTWSESVPISELPSSQSPAPAVDKNGTVHVVWTAIDPQSSKSALFYSYKLSGGSWSKPTMISGTAEILRSLVDPGSLTVDDNNVLYLVWHGGDIYADYGWYASKAPGENWSAPIRFLDAAYVPDIVVGSDGTLHVVTHAGGNIRYISKPPGGNWGDWENIPGGSTGAQMPSMAVDSAGTVHVVWRGGPCPDFTCQITYTAKPVGGTWSTPAPISGVLTKDGGAYPSLIAIGKTLYLVWEEGWLNSQIFYASKQPNGGWSIPVKISNTTTDANQPILAAEGGQAHVVWFESAKKSEYGWSSQKIFWSTANIDTTPPAITPSITGTLGDNGWYTSNVNVSWSVNDPESTITSTTGCGSSSVTTDTVGVTFACNATSAGGTASRSVTIKRDATVPTVNITSPDNFAVVPTGTTLNFSANDTLSGLASVIGHLSDGTTTQDVSNGFSIITAGVYTLTVEAKDNAGNTASETRFFVVYDPSAGFATGGGQFTPGGSTSDLGDALPGLDNSSPAKFGFVVKYQPGATTPDGQLEFQYKQGDFNLHSSGMDWLVIVNNNWAKFQGKATIKGLTGEYPFHVDARDGDFGGGNQSDRFVIKIWSAGANPDLDEPIYKASGDLTGGNIVIHTK